MIKTHEGKLINDNKAKFAKALIKNAQNLITTFIINEEKKKRLFIEFPKVLPIKKEGLRTFKTKENTKKKVITSLKIV